MSTLNRLPTEVRTPLGVVGVAAATAVVGLGGLSLGWWWLTVVVALLGTAAATGKRVVGAVLVGTVVAWVGLGVWQSGSRVLDVADFVGALALDSRGMGWLVVVITVLYAVSLALAGAWLGAAVRRLVVELRAAPAREGTAPEIATGSDGSDDEVKEAEHV